MLSFDLWQHILYFDKTMLYAVFMKGNPRLFEYEPLTKHSSKLEVNQSQLYG